MGGQLEIGYLNMGGSNAGTHAFLERCHAKGVDIIFVGECYMSKDCRGTNTHSAYTMGTRLQKGRRVAVYWKKELNDIVKVVMEEDRAMGVEVGKKRIFGVYGKSGGRRLNYEGWLDRIGRKSTQRDAILVGDWNAHHADWEEEEREEGKGRALAE